VRKVSEGIDIPRLIVGVYLTNYRTELYFRQFVGRIGRNQGTKFDTEAYVFMPKHWLLMEYADKIEQMQAVALSKETRDGGGGEPPVSRTVYIDDEGARRGGVLLPNSRIKSSDVSAIDQIMSKYRRLGMTETLAAQLVRDGGVVQPTEAATEAAADDESRTSHDDDDDLSLEEQMEKWRKVVSSKVRRVAFRRGAANDESKFKQVSIEVNDCVGVRNVNRASLDQLKSMSAYLDLKLAEESDMAESL
jgi:hypothetical protein